MKQNSSSSMKLNEYTKLKDMASSFLESLDYTDEKRKMIGDRVELSSISLQKLRDISNFLAE
jgi:ubiquinone biosynthesis protein Coq4